MLTADSYQNNSQVYKSNSQRRTYPNNQSHLPMDPVSHHPTASHYQPINSYCRVDNLANDPRIAYEV